MSIFDAGFIMWGFFIIYALVTVAYYLWMYVVNKKERDLERTGSTAGGEQK